jgi:hypothetical protein
VNSNPFPNNASKNGSVNAIKTGKERAKTMKITMNDLYQVLKPTLKTPSQEQAANNNGDFCLYHQHNRHDIGYCKEFHTEVKSLMA